MRERHKRAAELGTRALLDTFAQGDPAEVQPLGGLFAGLGDRAFGMLLMAAAAPAFIPVPGLAGGLSGPLVMLVGLQLLIRLSRPWLPGFMARRGPRRATLARLRDRLAPWFTRLERHVRPRMPAMLDHWLPRLFTGVLVFATGLLLTLPIPFTNYVLGVLALLFAFAYLERDGALMGVAWACGVATIVAAVALSDRLAALVTHFL
ncbi:exopolysaccharide biosynthesis protein [Cognatilysobacter lacus]|uniref:Exopolysaccharide biosynthesis protein n=1 Tax=Cognatilysobacter lacus TaxID=1643323 RepID=A0A5D8Z7B9_9GAMM|nr:exopolysaccharide biosynthesis protein [Lysobacter lacus]TZF89973.1 exopolysaccharide biosynthesis protein [Lysobacter lacus]